jgi:hypothetical protein
MPSSLFLFALAMLAGAIFIVIRASAALRVYRNAQTWPKVPAVITAASVPANDDGAGFVRLPHFAFRYKIAGVDHTSHRNTQGAPFPDSEGASLALVRKFPVGSQVQVAVNPEDPACAILDTGYPHAWRMLQRAGYASAIAGVVIIMVERLWLH